MVAVWFSFFFLFIRGVLFGKFGGFEAVSSGTVVQSQLASSAVSRVTVVQKSVGFDGMNDACARVVWAAWARQREA